MRRSSDDWSVRYSHEVLTTKRELVQNAKNTYVNCTIIIPMYNMVGFIKGNEPSFKFKIKDEMN